MTEQLFASEIIDLEHLESFCKKLSLPFDPLRQSYESSLYPGISAERARQALILCVRALFEDDPAYDALAVLLTCRGLYDKILMERSREEAFIDYVKRGVAAGRLNAEFLHFDLKALAKELDFSRDREFKYLGLQTLVDRYLLRVEDELIELPQFFWMRIAMGLSLKEQSPNEWAPRFYHLVSSLRYLPSTPTLFHAGTLHSQLSSCYLSTTQDSLNHIFKVFGDNAQLSKWAGGLGNDWTPIRATGSRIRGTNGLSQGIIPFLKVANDCTLAVNQGGKRRGACAAYLEVWHLDIEDFLELKKNTGDDRRRAHDMNTACWVPDLFMKRLQMGGSWTLFSPQEVPDLHETYGKDFEQRYQAYEKKAANGDLAQSRTVSAQDLWRKMLSMLFETGHPWITFKDPCNIRSPQDHVGVIHSSNLCTEITLNTSSEETAVCNLGSINLQTHLGPDGLDHEMLENSVSLAMRMLDNVIDLNFYPTKEAAVANGRHRPVGLGMMGFQDCLFKLGYPFDSKEAVEFADRSAEVISYFALKTSSILAQERGAYSTFVGSKWARGILPIDSIPLLERERGQKIHMDRSQSMPWDDLRRKIQAHGLRNSNCLAVAPTATIANIAGVCPSIEPLYSFLFVKSNLSGEFTFLNHFFAKSLKERGLWTSEIREKLKYYDGSIQEMDEIPDDLKFLFKGAFEVDVDFILEAASRRQKWLDQSQSLNLFLDRPDGKKLSYIYQSLWERGLKTSYYLRTKGATQVEKSTLDINRFGIQPKWMKNSSASSGLQKRACNLDDSSCEACQ